MTDPSYRETPEAPPERVWEEELPAWARVLIGAQRLVAFIAFVVMIKGDYVMARLVGDGLVVTGWGWVAFGTAISMLDMTIRKFGQYRWRRESR